MTWIECRNRYRERAMGFTILAFLVVGTVLLARPTPACAQEEEQDTVTSQLWASYQLFKPLEEKRAVLHVEGRSNGPDEPEKWKSIDGRGRLDFYPKPWLDAFPELVLRYTVENDDLNSFLLMPRVGVRFGLPSTEDLFHRERVPLRRFHLGLLLRLEWRTFFYSNSASDSSWRGRARFEIQLPINNASMGTNRTLYLRTDAEAFLPIGDEALETFANRLRLRLGLGFRFTYNWRLEALGIWQRSRNTLEDAFKTSEFMLSIRLRHYI